jgi:hypothetical protein
MALTQDQIKHIARLSRLSLSEEQIEHYRQNLDSIVQYMDILKNVPAEALAKVDAISACSLFERMSLMPRLFLEKPCSEYLPRRKLLELSPFLIS